MVPCDNNQGLRAVVPVPGGGHRRALVEAFHDRHFWASNPFSKTGKVEVRAILPNFLQTRGWAMRLDNPGGGSFTLGPRGSREIKPRLIGGQTFTPAEIIAAGQVSIQLIVLVDGLNMQHRVGRAPIELCDGAVVLDVDRARAREHGVEHVEVVLDHAHRVAGRERVSGSVEAPQPRSSCPDLIRASIHLRKKLFQKKMDCRVKPGQARQ